VDSSQLIGFSGVENWFGKIHPSLLRERPGVNGIKRDVYGSFPLEPKKARLQSVEEKI